MDSGVVGRSPLSMLGIGESTRRAYHCRRPSRDGRPCRKRVTREGDPCFMHEDKALPRIPVGHRRRVYILGYNDPRPKLRKPKRITRPRTATRPATPGRDAATRPAARLAIPVEAAIQELRPRALKYVDESQWQHVVARARHRGCRRLASLARLILRTKSLPRALLGTVLTAPLCGPERDYARQLATRIPLGSNETATAAARGLQLTGIYACISNGAPLTACACYQDIATNEPGPMINQLLTESTNDWIGLAKLPEKP